MPVSLVSSVWDAWLDRDLRDPDVVAGLLQPIDSEIIMEHPVSSRVNSVKNNGPELREKAEPNTLFS
jgi:putative SOS response-associated peptidase YedK